MGKDIVDHGAVGADDHANALAGCLRCLTSSVDVDMRWVGGGDDEADNKDGRQSHAVAMLSRLSRFPRHPILEENNQ